MTWQEIREQFPGRWVVVEALGAYTENGKRIIPDLQLVTSFGSDWREVWDAYKELHHADIWREYYNCTLIEKS